MTLSDSEKLAMLDEIIALSDLRQPPVNAFRLKDFRDRCRERGIVVSKDTARRRLLKQADDGLLETDVFGSSRYWWKAEECPT